MWYLLVAAGAGYFATKWQSGQKPRSLSAQSGQANGPSSTCSSPKKQSSSSQSNSIPASPNVVLHDSIWDPHSPRKKSSLNGFHSFCEKDITCTSPETMPDKKTSCEVFLGNPGPRQRESKDFPMFTTKCCAIAADNVENEEKLHEGNTDCRQKLDQDDTSPSPSSCCSSNSTVINSPVDSYSALQRGNGSLKAQGNECGSQPAGWQNGVFQFQGIERRDQPIEAAKQASNLSRNGSFRKESSRDVPIKRHNHLHESRWCDENLLDHAYLAPEFRSTAASASDNRINSDTGINASLTFTGKRHRDEPRPDHVPDEYSCTPSSRTNAKQGSCQSSTRKGGSTFCDVTSKNTAEETDDVDSNAFVGFGMAMAVCFMVSSSKKEMEKMGEVLRETEDLVNDMRKELDERKLHSSMNEYDSDEFFTIKPHDAIYQQGCSSEVIVDQMDASSTNGNCFYKDERKRSDTIEKAAKKYATDEKYGAASEIVEIKCEKREHKNAKTGGGHSNWQSNFGDFEESDSEGCEDDFTMSMIELERKLWQVFQERQEERILELEAALEVALSKLHVTEEELNWWKNRASWLMQQCFGSTSDELDKQNPLQSLEGLQFTNKEGIKIEPWPSSNETNLPVVEGFLESVEVNDSSLNVIGLPKKCLVRADSTGSTSSAESVLSINVNQSTHQLN